MDDKFNVQLLIAELLVRVKSLEDILVDSSVISRKDLDAKNLVLSSILSKSILENSNEDGSLDSEIQKLNDIIKPKIIN